MDPLLDEFFGHARVAYAGTPAWRPPTDVWETDDVIHVVMAISGMSAGEIEIELEADILVISGVRRDLTTGTRHYHAMEIQVGPFERVIRLNRSVAAERIEARYEAGCLRVVLPKAPSPPAGARRVPVR
jgi:HSP20 family protein